MASSDEGVPIFFDAASGNESDKERFAGLVRRYRELVDVEALFIADSALYSEPNLQALSDLRWVTRVPLTLKDAKRALDDVPDPKSPSLLARLTEVISTCRSRSHRFIIASNIPAESLSNDELLVEYKDQQVVERGFRFLRDPLFFTSSVFIKTPSRVAALAMIMALSLTGLHTGPALDPKESR